MHANRRWLIALLVIVACSSALFTSCDWLMSPNLGGECFDLAQAITLCSRLSPESQALMVEVLQASIEFGGSGGDAQGRSTLPEGTMALNIDQMTIGTDPTIEFAYFEGSYQVTGSTVTAILTETSRSAFASSIGSRDTDDTVTLELEYDGQTDTLDGTISYFLDGSARDGDIGFVPFD